MAKSLNVMFSIRRWTTQWELVWSAIGSTMLVCNVISAMILDDWTKPLRCFPDGPTLRGHPLERSDFPRETFEELQQVDRAAWKLEVMGHEELSSPSTTIYLRK
jgi:hypothetical protein